MPNLVLDAKLDFDTGQAQKRLTTFSKSLGDLSGQLAKTKNMGSGVFGSLVGFNLLQTGVSAVVGGFRNLIGFATNFNQSLETTRIGMMSVISAVDGIPFQSAGRKADQFFEDLKSDAIKSTATFAEMAEIGQSIIGPIRGAGFSMNVVREITNNTVSAANALNVDFAQASRDITMMARGSAGMHVKLYSMLRSTGAIAENAEEFNKLTAAERIEKLRAALKKFAEAGEAYGHSFAGAMSTFKDIMQQSAGKLFEPVFKKVTEVFNKINEYLIAHKDQIMKAMEAVGQKIAKVFDYMVGKGRLVFSYLTENWDELANKFQKVVDSVKTLAPMLLASAKAWAAVQLGRDIAAGGASVVGAVGGFGSMGALVASMAALGLVAATLVGAFEMVRDHWNSFMVLLTEFQPLFDSVGNDLKVAFTELWVAIKPILKTLGGGALTQMMGTVVALTVALKAMSFQMGLTAKAIGFLTDKIQPYVDEAMEAVISFFRRVVDVLKQYFGIQSGPTGPTTHGHAEILRYVREGSAPEAPANRNQTINDFRGSKITVNQEFREADPDRIALQMIEGLAREAEQRTQSGYVPALTR